MTMDSASRDTKDGPAQLGLFGEDTVHRDDAEGRQEESPNGIAEEALDHLNEVTERTGAAKFTSPTSIKERMKDGARLDDLLLVIDFCRAMWWGDRKMETFIRPRTLFGKENFPEYLVRARKWREDGRPSMKPSAGGGHARGVDYYVEKLEEARGR